MFHRIKTTKTEFGRVVGEVLSGLLFLPLACALSALVMLILVFPGWILVSTLPGLRPEHGGELAGALCLFIAALSWLGLWMRKVRASRTQQQDREDDLAAPNLVPLLAWFVGTGFLGIGSHFFYGRLTPELPLVSLVAIGLVVSLWRHPFKGQWLTPLLAVPLTLFTAYSLMDSASRVMKWNVALGSWEWVYPWVPFLVALIVGIESLKRSVSRWLAPASGGCSK